MRDHRTLKAFQKADALVLETYEVTASFPSREMFGLTAQMRRAAVSVASNVVEGCARHSQKEMLHFIDVAAGSAKELAYQLSVAERLKLSQRSFARAEELCDETVRMLSGLRGTIRQQLRSPADLEL
ncbi:MAG: four helix bundle protein [Gammaproteobacteria bacterium]